MKILVIRFSSIGDLTQSLSIPALIKENHPDAEVHFLTRSDFTLLLNNNPQVKKVWAIDRKKGFGEIFSLSKELRKEKFDIIYDAHNNLRSFFIRNLVSAKSKIVKPMSRFKRFLLLKFKINLFEKPFSGQRDLLRPLAKMGIAFRLPKPPLIFFDGSTEAKIKTLLETHHLTRYLVIVPSAAYALKRWPMNHWKSLVLQNPDKKIVVLAGPTDTFTEELNTFPNIINLTGKTSLLESAAIIDKAQVIISNDTGMLHFSEQLGKKTIALMGPAPFGFPSRPTTVIMEKNLPCRPCSKHGQGPCVNSNFHECMTALTPAMVQQHLESLWV
ncbi:glycosyltransferase family 9 protein [Bdellovibrio sp. qaytius]|nr:glycosyltransferase family 9 protein [Bdellovibrio sp. qaytius]